MGQLPKFNTEYEDLSQCGLFWKKSATVQARGYFKKVLQPHFSNFRFFQLVG